MVLVHRHFMKPRNVVYNIFSELTLNDSLLFFSKEIYWNCYRKSCVKIEIRTLSINFMLKLRFRENPLWNQNLKPNVVWKYTLRDNPNFALSFIFKFRKYYTVYNSGLKIWLFLGFFEIAQLFHLKFCLYLCWLGVGFSPHF